MTRSALINKHKVLFWYTPEDKKEAISDALLVETLLNYGTLNDIRELIETLGLENVARIFFSASGRQKGNYTPQIRHYFTLVFNRYAPQRDIK
ncbi:MAG: hypothetical protein IKI67_01300 [Bacteroidales bacterium]|nr:hypothetical protein [Bacteroidales bacterium]